LKSRRTDLHYREELIADIYLLNYYKGQWDKQNTKAYTENISNSVEYVY
jgi:hypothetical protein